MTTRNEQHTPAEISQIPIDRLASGLPYQRPVNERIVNLLVKHWDERLLDPLTVSFRDGKLYLVDGQHRVSALRKRMGAGEILAPCRVYYGLTYEEEAELSCRLDSAKHRLSLAQATNALLESGSDPEVTEIRRLIEANGFTWALDKAIPGAYEIRAARVVRNAYRLLGSGSFDMLLRLLAGAWRGAPCSLKGNFISGLTLFLKTYETELVERTAVKRLSRIDPEEVIRRGKTDFSTNRAALRYARVLWKKYNAQPGGRKLPYRFKE